MASYTITRSAQGNIAEIMWSVSSYTGSLNSGLKLYQDLLAHFEKTAFMPLALGREIEVGLRQTFCRNYRIIYRLSGEQSIEILTVIHASRLYPRP